MDKSEKKEVPRLKNQKEINELKAELLIKQNYKCPVTGYKITMSNSALDHDHSSGRIRGVLFAGANRMLQEEQWVRYGLRRKNIPDILRKMAEYLEQPQLEVLHPTHKAGYRSIQLDIDATGAVRGIGQYAQATNQGATSTDRLQGANRNRA